MRNSNKSNLSKGLIVFVFTAALVGFFGPLQLSRQLDELRIEEAHEALLTSLVDSRNFAWDRGVVVGICAATAVKQCTSLNSGEFIGWMNYIIDEKGRSTPLHFYPFHADQIALIGSHRKIFEEPLGFDAQGYSLQSEVVSIDLYSLSGLSKKSYTLVLEPSGALQTLVNMRPELTQKIAQLPSSLNMKEG
jgi:hypothetical protein